MSLGHVLAIDLGGTRIKAGLAEHRPGGAVSLLWHRASDSPRAGRDAILAAVADAARAVATAPVHAAGLCVPGLVDAAGTLVSLPGKLDGLEGTGLAGFLRSEIGVGDVVVTNDAIAYATGEAVAGAGRGYARAAVVTIGTGVGVTVIDAGRPVTDGIFGGGILGGFIPIADPSDGPADSIGRTDTIEALCAAPRITAGGAYDDIPALYEAHARDDPAARAAIDRYRERLARAVVALAHAHAPDVVVLGGGPMTPDNPITPGLEEAVNTRLFGTYRVHVRVASLGDEAALVGLASLLP